MDARDYVVTMRRALNDCPGYITYGQQVLTGANSAGIGNGDSSIWTTCHLQEGESVPAAGVQWSIRSTVEDHRFQDNDLASQWFDDSYWMQYYVGVNGGSSRPTPLRQLMKTAASIPISPVLRSRQHLLQDRRALRPATFDYSPGDQRQRDPFLERHRQLTIRNPRHVHARHHRDYLGDGQPWSGHHKQYDHLGGMVRPLLYQLCRPPLHGQLQPQADIVDACRLSPNANHNSQEQLTVSGRYHQQTCQIGRGGRRPTA